MMATTNLLTVYKFRTTLDARRTEPAAALYSSICGLQSILLAMS